MRLRSLALLAFAALAFASVGVFAADGAVAAAYDPPQESFALKPGTDVEVVQRHCLACHSVDYITTQPPAVAAGFWQAEVTKMIATFGAQIPDDDAGKITAYLNRAYRTGGPGAP